MAFNQWDRSRNENLKFSEDANGNPAIRIKIDKITLQADSSLEVYDPQGFLVFSVDTEGNVRYAGQLIQL